MKGGGPESVSADVAWLACPNCLGLVEAHDRAGLVDWSMAYQRRRDAERGIKRSSSEETEMRRATESHFENVFWIERDEPIVDE
jgi:hypothetical protein